MNNEWQQYLTGNGAEILESGQVSFSGDNQLAPSSALCALTGQIVLRITGDDAADFLQGQFSNDVAALGTPVSQLTTWSSPKGRVLTLFRLYKDEAGYLIAMPGELAESFTKRLRMYVLRAKVVVEEQPDLVCIGISGSSAGQQVNDAVGAVPSQTDDCVVRENVIATRIRGAMDRFEIIAPVNAAQKIWAAGYESSQPCGETVWRLQNIDAGVPGIGSQTTEAFVLQMLNLQHIDGVSFKKGCFPGQEVVARMQYLGKLKRRMYRATGQVEDGFVPAPGDDVFNKDGNSAVGKIVDAQPVGDGSYRMLVVFAIASTEKPLYLEAEGVRAVELMELPYSIEAS